MQLLMILQVREFLVRKPFTAVDKAPVTMATYIY